MWPPRTLVITSRARVGGDASALIAFVAAAAEAGVDAVQVRERDWDDRQLLHVVRAIGDAVRHTGCRVLVNERAHVAWAAGAHGVHLRGNGMPALRVRAVQPAGQGIGRSVHAGDAASAAAGCDYVLFGTVFPSVSKPDDAPVAGLEALAHWAGLAGAVPVLAVGGIEPAGCAAVRAAGARGVAGIELFVSAYARGAAVLAAAVRDIHAVFGDGERAQ